MRNRDGQLFWQVAELLSQTVAIPRNARYQPRDHKNPQSKSVPGFYYSMPHDDTDYIPLAKVALSMSLNTHCDSAINRIIVAKTYSL